MICHPGKVEKDANVLMRIRNSVKSMAGFRVCLVVALLLGPMPLSWACDPGCYATATSGSAPKGDTDDDGGCNNSSNKGDGSGCDQTANQGQTGSCAKSGQPVSLYSGRETSSITDMVVDGVFPIHIVRKYDSQSQYDSPMGYGWALTLDRRLYKYADGSIIVRSECGKRSKFIYTGGAYQSPVDDSSRLEEQPDGSFVLFLLSGYRHLYDKQGKLTTIVSPDGHRLEMTYVDSDSDTVPDRLTLTGSSPFSLDPTTPSVVARDYRLYRIEEREAQGELTGNAVTLTYHASGRLDTITDQDGRTVTYHHDTSSSEFNGNLLSVDGLGGVTSTYQYEDYAGGVGGTLQDPHNVTTIQHSAQDIPVVNIYDAQDRVIQQTRGNEVRGFAYASNGVTTLTHTINDADTTPLARSTLKAEFDGKGYPKKRTETLYTPNGASWVAGPVYRLEQDRDSDQNVTEERWYDKATGGTPIRRIEYSYNDDNQKLLERTHLASGEIITKTWGYDYVDPSDTDDQEKVLIFEQTESSLRPKEVFRTEYTYHQREIRTGTTFAQPLGKLKAVKRMRADGTFQTTYYEYNTTNRGLARVILPDGVRFYLEYAEVTLNGRLANRPTQTYFQGGWLKRSYEWSDYDTPPQWVEDSFARKTDYTYEDYNDEKRIKTITNRLGETTEFTYNGDNLELIEIGRHGGVEGQVIRLSYTGKWVDKVERKKSVSPETWVTIAEYKHSGRGDITQVTRYREGQPLVTSYRYDGRGNLLEVTDAESNVTRFTYDSFDNRVQMIEAATSATPRTTDYTYDALDRLTQITQDVGGPKEAVTTMTYDAVGNLLTVTDPENKTTTYTYDRLSRRTSVKQPNGDTVYYGYTLRDQVAWVVNARGHKIAYGYYPWGGLAGVSYFADVDATTASRTVLYNYDTNGNLTGVTDDSIQGTPLYTFSYDWEDRLDGTTVGYLLGVTLDNNYDHYGNRDQFVLNDGAAHTHSYTYNKLNQLSAISLPGSSQDFTPEYYESLGRLKSLTYPSGIKTTYSYYDNGTIQQILTETGGATPVTLEQLDYVYDAFLNVDTLTSQRDGGLHDYGYDSLDHLTSATHPNQATETFSYDLVGNRTNSGYGYNDNHQITQSPGVVSYTFDVDGNMTDKDYGSNNVDVFTYNEDNRLVGFTDYDNSANNATYGYDPFGRRIWKEVNGVRTYFVWDGSRLMAEYNGSGTRTARYAYLPEGLVPAQFEDGNGTYNVHVDHLQTPKYLTDATGQVVWSQVQTSFGQFTVDENPDGDGQSIVFNVRFPGQWADGESGLYYNYYRDYDPELGRYIQRDPMGLWGGLNLFVYTSSSPVNYIDPYGLVEGSASNVAKRNALAQWAAAQSGSNSYSKSSWLSPQYPSGAWKCSGFVCDAARHANAPTDVWVPDGNGGTYKRCATAAELAKGNVPQWRELRPDEVPEPGDIVAQRRLGPTSTGHTAVVVSDGSGGTTTTGAHQNGVTTGQDYFSNPTYKRYTGD